VSIVSGFTLGPMVGDPDDHRPTSSWAVLADPGDAAGRVDGLTVIIEAIGPGDRIPLHIHRVDEVILPHGPGRFRLGDTTQHVDAGAIVFIPAGAPHGLQNEGGQPLSLHAVFPSDRIWLRYLERNPAPGTERDPIGPAVTYDVRAGTVEPDPA
jgi:quercetin dioxygenase-like cupin family protein